MSDLHYTCSTCVWRRAGPSCGVDGRSRPPRPLKTSADPACSRWVPWGPDLALGARRCP